MAYGPKTHSGYCGAVEKRPKTGNFFGFLSIFFNFLPFLRTFAHFLQLLRTFWPLNSRLNNSGMAQERREKYEIRNSKSETNPNYQNSNDQNADGKVGKGVDG